MAPTPPAAPRALGRTRGKVLVVLTAPIDTKKQPRAQSKGGVVGPNYHCRVVHPAPPLCATPAGNYCLNIAPRPSNGTTLDVPARPAPSPYLPPHSTAPTAARARAIGARPARGKWSAISSWCTHIPADPAAINGVPEASRAGRTSAPSVAAQAALLPTLPLGLHPARR